MVGSASESGRDAGLLCQRCGKRWPTSYSACPEDGTALTDDETAKQDLHALQTFLLPDGRGWNDKLTLGDDGEMAPATPAIGDGTETGLHIEESDADTVTGNRPVITANRTVGPIERTGVSSEPPTVIARRYDHIELPPGSIVDETYEIQGKLGAGAMGTVYAAVHIALNKRVAIKVIGAKISRDADAVSRFQREARVLAQLKNPHVVDVSGFGTLPDGRPYFVMEYLHGESLRDRIERGRIPLDEALDILDQTARGLETAHAAGIVHRDLKPENIFVERDGAAPLVKLLDFGIVKIAKQTDDSAKTQAGALIGTPLYMAPEQASNAAAVDQRADIYSLGCVAFELVLGHPPFLGASAIEIIAAHLAVSAPAPRSIWPEVPALLDALLVTMLAKEPSKRPTLGHLLDVIETLRNSGERASSVDNPAPVVPSTKRQVRRWPRGYAIGAGAFVLVLVGAITFVAAGNDAKIAPRTSVTEPAPIVAPITAAPAALSSPTVVTPVPPALTTTARGEHGTPTRPTEHTSAQRVTVPTSAAPLSLPATTDNARTAAKPTSSMRPTTNAHGEPTSHALKVDPNGTINPFASKGSGQ